MSLQTKIKVFIGFLIGLTIGGGIIYFAMQISHAPSPADEAGAPPPLMEGTPREIEGKAIGELTAQLIADGESKNLNNANFEAKGEDESAVIVRGGGSITITNGTLLKTGASSNVEASNFSGQNAVVLVGEGNATLNNMTIVSDAEGANALFSTGKNSSLTLQNGKIHTKQNSSRGLDATFGGNITARDFEVTTEGAHSGAIATDRGEGTVSAERAKIITRGEGSPCIYSTGNISLRDSKGEAFNSEMAVIDGKNSITLERVELIGHKQNGVMIYQTFAGRDDAKEATLFARDSTLNNRSQGAMFFVTNTKATVTLERVGIVQDGNVLINIKGDRWGKEGDNGGDLMFDCKNQQLKGDALIDALSSLRMNLTQNTNWTGSLNKDRKALFVSLRLDRTSRLVLTADSYVTELINDDNNFGNIESNGFTIYYDEKKSPTLGGRTITLPGGGALKPMQ